MENANKPKIKQPRVTELTENKIESYLERRKFEGKYVAYKTARQFSSAGNASSEQLGQESDRHEYFSDLERRFGITLSYLKNVSAVKTQYPLLDVDTTLRVATRLNIPHPRFAPKSGVVKDENQGYQAAIMTTDFLFQYADVMTGELKKIAVSLKYDDDIVVEDGTERIVGRTRDKLEIERTYWTEERKTEFKLITSSHWTVGSVFVKNIDTARGFRDLDIPHGILKASQIAFLEELQRTPQYRLADLISKVSQRTVISFEKTFAIFWYLIWHKGLRLDLFRPLTDASFVFNAKEDFAWAW
ncbi:MAG: TnsA endonuclease N-terminal domain-containing protein [Paraglaciecola sp.]|uniref:TnsA endonuclease N-terminal domain-containing protein n=1 Tax=Paraglaciecola sp. TaxID=1920173 RepID=UPI002740249E|nr:TnsA endonuclease N-terminal domain-containing protein [Paraglaciecola sp.]MDP5031656.1 TnsA endonuclease N-terminal domain-containing protein [Paraglaciecola sp.]MDP5134092.1 TnsA endonuclease N-terminal domain-containing protein [Paraglaciecola sp.]